jgi:hypothetical protein
LPPAFTSPLDCLLSGKAVVVASFTGPWRCCATWWSSERLSSPSWNVSHIMQTW